jgi:predicted TIM-barrel fold metal-dependent hydrolase
MLINTHAHVVLPGFQNQHPFWGPTYDPMPDGGQMLRIGDWRRPVSNRSRSAESVEERDRKRRDPAVRVAQMDAAGQDVQILSMPSHYVMYQAEIDFAAPYAATVNRTLAEYCAAFPERLAFWAHVPLQDPDAAAREIDHAIGTLGARGISAGGAGFGHYEFDSEELFPVWAKLCDYDLPIFVHGHNQSLNWAAEAAHERYDITSICGMPYDETRCFWNLICGGVLDRFPSLKVYIAHGGGYFPYHLGRLALTNASLPDARNRKPLRNYLGNFYVDPHIEELPMRRALIEVMGADQVLYGDNFGGGDAPHGDLLDGILLSESDQKKIRFANAANLLQLYSTDKLASLSVEM